MIYKSKMTFVIHLYRVCQYQMQVSNGLQLYQTVELTIFGKSILYLAYGNIVTASKANKHTNTSSIFSLPFLLLHHQSGQTSDNIHI